MTSLRQVRDPTRLAPPDTIYTTGTTYRASPLALPTDDAVSHSASPRTTRKKHLARRGLKPSWQKLLWVPQAYPDNYTDEATFLDHLQRNPRLRPYEFWPLVAEGTVIVQHVCSVAIFVCCFAGIYQERTSPITVAYCGSGATILGWIFCEFWLGHDKGGYGKALEAEKEFHAAGMESPSESPEGSAAGQTSNGGPCSDHGSHMRDGEAVGTPLPPLSKLSHQNGSRFTTIKSAILIYCALLGLSPILKSLTKSTSSDSIWAMSCWLMIINVFFFDYTSEVRAKFPASLSMNAGVMASTVLASRLTSTTDVFLLMLFSIEVFALFPIFRLHLRRANWHTHLALTTIMVGMAGCGLGLTMTGGGWKAGITGTILGYLITSVAMGTCSWWLISLQKYKNELHGPWDPARPVIRRHWA